MMADQPVTIRRERIGRPIRQFLRTDIARLNIALALVIRLADRFSTENVASPDALLRSCVVSPYGRIAIYPSG